MFSRRYSSYFASLEFFLSVCTYLAPLDLHYGARVADKRFVIQVWSVGLCVIDCIFFFFLLVTGMKMEAIPKLRMETEDRQSTEYEVHHQKLVKAHSGFISFRYTRICVSTLSS